MYRVRRCNVRWYRRWPLKGLWPKKVDERFCPKCNQPYINGPAPDPVAQFHCGNVAAILFPAGDWKREHFVVTLGRWKTGSGRFYHSELIPDQELDDVEEVIAQVWHYLSQEGHRRPTRRAVRDRDKGTD